MTTRLPIFTGILFMLGTCFSPPTHAQYVNVGGAVGLVGIIAAQNAAKKAIAERTTTTTTYRGQSFPMKRTPDDILVGDAADRITQLETQLGLCHTALLADSTSQTCSSEREATIRSNMNYIGLNRPDWELKAYRQELRFYQTEDKRRRQAAK